MDLSLVGERLRSERERAGLGQQQLAERTQLSASTVTRIENGTHTAVTLAELDRLAVALGVPVRQLTSGSPARDEAEAMDVDTEASRPRRVDLSRLIERGRPEGERRLTVNPDPLKVVASRPGGPMPDRGHVLALKLAIRSDGTRLQRVSVHREGCPRIPVVNGRNAWVSKIATRDEIGRVVEQADKVDVPTSISCRTCGGWSALP